MGHIDAIDTIRERVTGSRAQMLDRVIPDHNALRRALDVVELSSHRTAVCDVPVRAVVGLGRGDASNPGDTWRNAATMRLTDPWAPECLGIFEGPLYHTWLPMSSARFALDLSSVGGAVYCANGNHRLIAAVAWLAATLGDDAVLRAVKLNVAECDEQAIDAILELRRHGPLRYKPYAGGWAVKVERIWGFQQYIHIKPGKSMRRKRWHPKARLLASDTTMFDGDDKVWEPFPDQVLDAWRCRNEWSASGEFDPSSAAALVLQQHGRAAAYWCIERMKDGYRQGSQDGRSWQLILAEVAARMLAARPR